MPNKNSKRLVIDACVARAAGPPQASYPTSAHCRDFLLSVLRVCHRVVMTSEIKEEWDQHQSRFARQWLGSMIAKKKVCRLKDLSDRQVLWQCLENAAQTDQQWADMVKDIHLLEAAIASDHAIVSLDENTARKLFRRAAQDCPDIQDIVWVNPDRVAEEQPIMWLENGARPEKERLLGYDATS